MILSMTGFGDAVIEDGSHRYHLEIRSVNNRYFKANIRLPEQFAFLEPEVEKQLRARVTRGSLTVYCYESALGAESAYDLNLAAVRHYAELLRPLLPIDGRATIDLAVLATLPGVCQPRELSEAQREAAWGLVRRLLDAAMERLIAMRREEGRSLAEDLARHCEVIRSGVAAVRARAPLVVQEYQRRLAARVQELIHESGVRLAEEDLVREVGIFAERSDISEELARVESHLDQFRECVRGGGEPAGRKLEFIAQELLREANTIGSKASDALIARQIIEIKGAIDRLKEQVQNVE